MHLLAKGLAASAAIAAYTIAKPGGAAQQCQPAAAATDKIIGVNADVAKAVGEVADVIVAGEAYVLSGGVFAEGDPITSDATGRGVLAAPAAGTNNRLVGYALEASAAAGSIVRINVVPSVMQG